MTLNDHVLKGAGILPPLVTGKLSDFAFLFFAPIILAFVTKSRSLAALAVCYAAPSLLYVAINVSPALSDGFAALMSLVVPMQLWPDPEDLVALAILPLSWRYLVAQGKARAVAKKGGSTGHKLVVVAAALSCLATSPPRTPMRAPTHRPVYMSWQELRTNAVAVLPPRPIRKRGKLLVVDQHLFVSEPGQGIHVFENQDPSRPRAMMFIRVPGNVDVAVRDDLLYADSFVDLLTFRLDLARDTATLVGRLEGQFAYDAYQALDRESIVLGVVDETRGVVVRAEPIPAEERESDE
jgi:hypothetical protein